MLDGWAKRQIDPLLHWLARPIARSGCSPNTVTLAGLGLGLAAAIAIALDGFIAGLVLILLSRLCDGLDGAIARISGKTSDVGGYLDIVLDFLFYGAIPLAFVIADPAMNAIAGATLLFAFYVNGASFLAFAAIAVKRQLPGEARGPKSIYFTAGLTEASETLAFFLAFCLFPAWFAPLAYLFAGLCLATAMARILQAAISFRD